MGRPMPGRHWVRHGHGHTVWTLEHRGRTEATLQWQGMLEAYRLTFAGENWTIDVAGWLKKRIVVQDSGLQRYEGTLQGFGADIAGHAYGPLEWRRVGRWRARYELRADGRPAVARLEVRRDEIRVQVETGLPDAIPLLAAGLVAHLAAAAETGTSALLGGLGSAVGS
jgi:hypothetical protein